MDEKIFDDLKKQNEVDNSRLEELMEGEITPSMQREFIEIFKESRLFLPVVYSQNIFEELEDSKVGEVGQFRQPVGFDINFLTDDKGNKVVPLFTSSEIMEKAGLRCSTYVLYMSDLAEMLKDSDRYAAVAINPLTPHDIMMSIDGFLNIFRELTPEQKEMLDAMDNLLKLIEDYSIELEENTTLFIRSNENLMIDEAVDGVFIAQAPFYASSNPKYREDLKYTNILLMPKSKRILPLGPDKELDILIAPGTVFRLQDVMDETQNLWMCEDQPFFNE